MSGAGTGGWIASLRDPLNGRIAVLLTISAVLGGGGIGSTFLNLATILTALAVFASAPLRTAEFFQRAPRVLLVLTLLTLALPIVQLLPLPADLWQGLPGRDLVADILKLDGIAITAMPFSVQPSRTILAAVALIPAAAALILAFGGNSARQQFILSLIVAMGLLNCAVGVVQLASGGNILTYQETMAAQQYTQLTGTFSNRNTSGLFLVCCLCALIGITPLRRRSGTSSVKAMQVAAGLLLLVGVILTQSRSATTLLAVPLSLLGLRLFQSRSSLNLRKGHFALGALGLVLLVGVIAAGIGTNTKLQQTTKRFANVEDSRPLIWEDSLVSAQRFWPLGAGMGTFDTVFLVDESLESLEPMRPGRAHNDYLELAIEAGVPGLVLLAGWMLYVALAAFRPQRAEDMRPARDAAFAALLAIALQSVLDYPLRNETMLCLIGLLIAILVSPRATTANR